GLRCCTGYNFIIVPSAITLHIVSYMTVLHLYNTDPAFQNMRFFKLRQTSLSTLFTEPHDPPTVYSCFLHLYPHFNLIEMRKYITTYNDSNNFLLINYY